MRNRFPLILAASSCFTAGYAHSLSHGWIHGARHLAHARAAASSSTNFAGVAMFPNGTLSGLDLSSACETALYSTVDCDDNISSLITNDYIGSFDNATTTASVCAASCETSITNMYNSVLSSCGVSAELTQGMTYLSLINQLWSNWNQSCFVDPTTGQNCNGKRSFSLPRRESHRITLTRCNCVV